MVQALPNVRLLQPEPRRDVGDGVGGGHFFGRAIDVRHGALVPPAFAVGHAREIRGDAAQPCTWVA
jgi:hypothetical protein